MSKLGQLLEKVGDVFDFIMISEVLEHLGVECRSKTLCCSFAFWRGQCTIIKLLLFHVVELGPVVGVGTFDYIFYSECKTDTGH